MRRTLVALALLAAGCGGGDGERESEPTATVPARITPEPGRALFLAHGCGSCHTFKVAAASGAIGTDLDQTVPGMSRDQVIEEIVAPQADVAGSVMPSDFAERMNRTEIEQLADYVRANAGR